MIGSLSLVDILFLVTIVLLVFNGLRNGFVFSLVNLLSLPIAFVVAALFGPQVIAWLAANNLHVTPLITYIVLFFVVVLVIHAVGSTLRGTVKAIPLVSSADTLLGGVVGFVEAWLLWVILLFLLHGFLQNVDQVQKLGIAPTMFQDWQHLYNTAITNSLFAKVNGFIISTIPLLPLPK